MDSFASKTDILVQMGRPAKVEGRHVNLPIELGSTFLFDTLAMFEAARDARYDNGTLYYGRYGTEASFQLETMLAALEQAAGVTLTSSGVAAISTCLLSFARPGTHLLVADNVYGNTRAFCDTMLKQMQVEVEYYDPMIGAGLAELLRENTCAVMFEAPGSGTFEVPDIPAIAAAARAAGVPSIIDNTWATPLFCQPLELGCDVSLASCSKYLSGHSDSMMGMIAANSTYHMRIRKTVMAIGDKPGAQEIFLTLRGLRTLRPRMAAIDTAGRAIANWLAARPEVETVLHPALATCPGHDHWLRDFQGAAGLFAIVLRPATPDSVRAFVDGLHHFGIGVSWGGYESLILPMEPPRTACLNSGPNARQGALIRFNIGLDDIETLKGDLAAALPLLAPQD